MKSKRFPVLFLALMFLVSCAAAPQTNTNPVPAPSAQATAYKALMSSKAVYDTAFKTMAALDAQGKLPADVKAKAIKAGDTYMAAHNLAVQELLDGRTPDLTTVNKALDAFLIVAAPYYQP
jgi:PBP1b-binding outer membrane lipoprotein LpoB